MAVYPRRHRNALLLLNAIVAAAATSPSPAEFVKSMGIGINLGNVLDAPYEASWAKPAKERYFDDYHSAGFKSVRVPVRWDHHTLTASPWTVNSTFLDRVEEVVGWSISRGLRTIVNTHHDDWLDGAADDDAFTVQLQRLTAIWAQIAERFKSHPDHLLAFEVYNEPHFNMTVDWLNRMNTAVLPVIRATNPRRNVLFGGLKFMNPNWITSNPDAMAFPADDDHVFLEVHSYDPYSFCGMTAGSITHTWSKSTIDGWADKVAAWASQRNISVLLGEFGVNNTQTNTTGRVAWYTYVRETVEAKGFAATVWDDSGQFAIYDRDAGTWDTDVLRALGLNSSAVGGFSAAPLPPSKGLPQLEWQP